MGRLRVVRPNDRAGRYRTLVVVVDGQRAGGLRPNQQTDIELTSGTHQVVGRMDWVRSAPIDVDVSGESSTPVVELSLPFRAIFDIFIRPGRAIRSRRLK